jgi:hypothetical protein
MNLYGNAANIKEIDKTKYGCVNHKIDVWSCIMFGVSVAYIIWFVLINPLKSIQLW